MGSRETFMLLPKMLQGYYSFHPSLTQLGVLLSPCFFVRLENSSHQNMAADKMAQPLHFLSYCLLSYQRVYQPIPITKSIC